MIYGLGTPPWYAPPGLGGGRPEASFVCTQVILGPDRRAPARLPESPPMNLDYWDFVLWVHLLAMALFVGGQLFLGLAVVPVFREHGGSDGPARDWMVPVARRYGWASLAALAILLVSGAMMASHFDLWDSTAMSAKLGLVTVAIVLTCLHVFVTRGSNRLLQSLILLDSLAIVLVATAL